MVKRIKSRRTTSKNGFLEKIKNRPLNIHEIIEQSQIDRMDKKIKKAIPIPDERKAYISALITAFGG